MRALRTVILGVSLFFLAGCTAFESYNELRALNRASAVGSPFSQALVHEYKIFANSEFDDMFDYPDALHFARKGLAVASGALVEPEVVADWNLHDDFVAGFTQARADLMAAFGRGAREQLPEVAAQAQAAFDCWIEQQEEDLQSKDIDECRTRFETALERLNAGVIVEPTPVQAVPRNLPQKAMYLVFFNWDAYNLSSTAQNVVQAVANEIAKRHPATVSVVGYADTSGNARYNKRLAFKRANQVRDALVAQGVDPNRLSIDAQGEKELMVDTADNVREPANRRVSITLR